MNIALVGSVVFVIASVVALGIALYEMWFGSEA